MYVAFPKAPFTGVELNQDRGSRLNPTPTSYTETQRQERVHDYNIKTAKSRHGNLSNCPCLLLGVGDTRDSFTRMHPHAQQPTTHIHTHTYTDTRAHITSEYASRHTLYHTQEPKERPKACHLVHLCMQRKKKFCTSQ
jgi:hypothetical protein